MNQICVSILLGMSLLSMGAMDNACDQSQREAQKIRKLSEYHATVQKWSCEKIKKKYLKLTATRDFFLFMAILDDAHQRDYWTQKADTITTDERYTILIREMNKMGLLK